jgi:hypothetical protein
MHGCAVGIPAPLGALTAPTHQRQPWPQPCPASRSRRWRRRWRWRWRWRQPGASGAGLRAAQSRCRSGGRRARARREGWPGGERQEGMKAGRQRQEQNPEFRAGTGRREGHRNRRGGGGLRAASADRLTAEPLVAPRPHALVHPLGLHKEAREDKPRTHATRAAAPPPCDLNPCAPPLRSLSSPPTHPPPLRRRLVMRVHMRTRASERGGPRRLQVRYQHELPLPTTYPPRPLS